MKFAIFEDAGKRDNDSKSLNVKSLMLATVDLDHAVPPPILTRQHARELNTRNAGCHPRAQAGKSNLH